MSKFKLDKSSQSLLFGYNIDEFLPETHIARIVEEIVNNIDTSRIEEKYSDLGQKSYEPKTLIKILFYGYAKGVFSSRKLMMSCRESLPFMYLARLYKPDFRTISDFRKDNIKELEKYFVEVLKYCNEIGMLKVGAISIDGSKFRANALSKRSKDISGYNKWEERLCLEINKLMQQAENIDKEENNKLSKEQENIDIPKEIKKRKDLITKIKKAKSELIAIKKEREKDKKKQKEPEINLTDKDAKFQRERIGVIRTNYNAQISTNKEQIIIAADITTNAADCNELIPMIKQSEENTKEKINEVKADSGYASYENYGELEERKIDGYIPDNQYRRLKRLKLKGKIDMYDKNNFKYNKEKEIYICPDGKELRYKKRGKNNTKIYQGIDCPQCKYKELCTKGKYRTIYRHDLEYLQEAMRKKLDTAEGEKKYYERMNMVESPFGHFKKNLGFTQFSMRGTEKVRGEFRILCTAFNILKIYKWKLCNNNS